MPTHKGLQFVGFEKEDWRNMEEAKKQELCVQFFQYFTDGASLESLETSTKTALYLRSQDYIIKCMRCGILKDVAKQTLAMVSDLTKVYQGKVKKFNIYPSSCMRPMKGEKVARRDKLPRNPR